MAVSEEQIETIIEEYQENECLWQKSHMDYKNKHKKEAAYEAIAEKTNLEKQVIKDKLHSLRTIYFQNATKYKKQKSGSSGGKPVKWKHFERLNFLATEVAESGRTDSMKVTVNDIPVTFMDSTSKESEPIPKKKRENDDRTKCWSALVDAIQKDEQDDFVQFVSYSLKQIKNESVRNNAKKNIKRILVNSLLEDDEHIDFERTEGKQYQAEIDQSNEETLNEFV